MANHGYQIHTFCLLAMMICKGSSLAFLNQCSEFLWDPSLLWVMDQFDPKPSLDTRDSSPLQCRFFLVMSIRWNRDVLHYRRFVSGAFSRCRWIFRLSTGVFPLTRRYGGFTWVFDPGINMFLAADEAISKLVMDGFIPSSLMEKKENSQAPWVTSCRPVPLSPFREDEEDNPDLVSNRRIEKSSKRATMIRREAFHMTIDHEILCVWIGILRTKERAKVSSFVLLPSQRYHYVVYYISDLQIETLLSKRFAKIKFSHVMLHSNRLREKSNLKLENSSSSERKASSNSTVFFLVYGTYKCVCNDWCYCMISL